MSYQTALEAAGAEVLQFEQFGSYQGDWFAKVRVNGVEGWIHGYYGSCSGCDAFEGEFGYDYDYDYEHEHGENVSQYSPEFRDGCEQCADLKKRLAEFGASYLDDVLTQVQAEAMAEKNLEWDYDAKDMLAFLKANPLPVVS